MASLGHLAVGVAAGRRVTAGTETRALGAMLLLAAAALAPDLDVITFRLGISYHAPFGHRGASHSLVAALLLGLAFAWPLRALGLPLRRSLVAAVLVAASHGLLDTLTNGGLGVALLWPWSNARYFAPWRPLPVAPIGFRLLSPRGLHVLLVELVGSAPLLWYALRRPLSAPEA